MQSLVIKNKNAFSKVENVIDNFVFIKLNAIAFLN